MQRSRVENQNPDKESKNISKESGWNCMLDMNFGVKIQKKTPKIQKI